MLLGRKKQETEFWWLENNVSLWQFEKEIFGVFYFEIPVLE